MGDPKKNLKPGKVYVTKPFLASVQPLDKDQFIDFSKFLTAGVEEIAKNVAKDIDKDFLNDQMMKDLFKTPCYAPKINKMVLSPEMYKEIADEMKKGMFKVPSSNQEGAWDTAGGVKIYGIDMVDDLTKPKGKVKLGQVKESMEKQMPYSVALWQFGETETTKGNATPEILGGKGMGLVEMARLGLPVPPGVIIPTGLSNHLLKGVNLKNGDDAAIADVAIEVNGLVLGYIASQLGYQPGTHPLVSVRSGARVSMPGMMDTILNVGISKKNLVFWQNKLGDKVAYDCLLRLMRMYGTIVCDIPDSAFDEQVKKVMKFKYGQDTLPTSEKEFTVDHLSKLVDKFESVYEAGDNAFPDTLLGQLQGSIGAVFNSWNSERAKVYRKLNKIPDDWGTACVVQAMVFGNANEQSCTGVLFSRDPSTGWGITMGDFLPNGQGEELVSGKITPKKLEDMYAWNKDARTYLGAIAAKLENHYRDMVDVEFTVENGKVYILQVRIGKRTAQAAFRIAYTLESEGIIDKVSALKRVTAQQYQTLLKETIDPSANDKPLATGLAGSKGLATGRVWLSSEKAKQNPGGILVTQETTPDDFPGMAVSAGILTATGGLTCHAAVVARGMDKACVVGCSELKFTSASMFFLPIHDFYEGDVITIDGNTGHVYAGAVPTIGGTIPDFVHEMVSWATPKDVVIQYDARDNLPDEGEVHINCLSLKTHVELMQFMDKLAQKPNLTGVLTFQNNQRFNDATFLKSLALPSGEGHKMTLEQANALHVHMTQHDAAKNWTVMNLAGNCGKFKRFKKVVTLKDFLEVDGYYELDKDVKTVLFQQGLTVEEFVEMLKKSGKTLKQVSTPILKSQLPFTVFG